MAKDELSKRKIWQDISGAEAIRAEQTLYDVFDYYFENTDYILHKKPKHLKNLYTQINLSNEVLNEIYNPDIDLSATNWGVSPDFAIENTRTGKILFGEIKRQDGWVEGKSPSAGRGNAHERLGKLFAPGLIKAYRKAGGIYSEDILPFWVVFIGDITRDPKRVREVSFWFDKYCDNYFMWRPNMSCDDLINHFNKKLKKYLD